MVIVLFSCSIFWFVLFYWCQTFKCYFHLVDMIFDISSYVKIKYHYYLISNWPKLISIPKLVTARPNCYHIVLFLTKITIYYFFKAAVGISVPVDIEFFRISINWCFQANYFVPTKAEDYTHGIGAGIVTYETRRKRELREVTTGELYRNLQSVLQE